jgi:hypothetical protein
MAKKVRFYQLWNFKNIIASVLIFAITGALLFYLYSHQIISDNKRLESFNSSTKGYLISYEKLTQPRQTKLGTEYEISGYKVKFTYTINGKNYESETEIDGLPKYQYILNKKLDKQEPVIVLYKKKDPTKSTVNLNK